MGCERRGACLGDGDLVLLPRCGRCGTSCIGGGGGRATLELGARECVGGACRRIVGVRPLLQLAAHRLVLLRRELALLVQVVYGARVKCRLRLLRARERVEVVVGRWRRRRGRSGGRRGGRWRRRRVACVANEGGWRRRQRRRVRIYRGIIRVSPRVDGVHQPPPPMRPSSADSRWCSRANAAVFAEVSAGMLRRR